MTWNVTAALGTTEARGGSTIASTGAVDNAQLTVAGNVATGTAIADNAANSLTVTAGAIADGTKEAGTSGAMPGSTQGAAGTFAVANNQKLAEPSFGGTLTPTISRQRVRRLWCRRRRPGSNIVDLGRRQPSNAPTRSATPPSIGSPSPVRLRTVAVRCRPPPPSSAQDGRAEVSATSDALFTVPGDMASSTASLSRNTNLALAVINDAVLRSVGDGPGPQHS